MTGDPVGAKLWVVYEANSIVPKLFTDEAKAYAYRTKRIKRGIRHQIYVQPAWVDEEA